MENSHRCGGHGNCVGGNCVGSNYGGDGEGDGGGGSSVRMEKKQTNKGVSY